MFLRPEISTPAVCQRARATARRDEASAWLNTVVTGSLQGTVRLRGNPKDMVAEAPETITADDFRLRPDSAGYRAGKDGKDLGADVDLVGPGPAYERWKKTPEFQRWLKDSGQVK